MVITCLLACATDKKPSPGDLPLSNGENFNLGDHSFPISTSSSEAQSAFDRGLTLSYAFSHAAAEREFRRAAELDPKAPMPWWGVALVNGPHINYPLVPENKAKTAWEALGQATKRLSNANALEKDLIHALSTRYVEHQGEDRSKLDQAYAQAMKTLWFRYPKNADIGTFYAEALMDLHPWDLYNKDGSSKAWTPEIVNTLEQAISLNNNHPGANHLYIHAVEGSTSPERAVRSADLLQTLVPGAGHLVHMPAHIYLRVGRWEDAAKANEQAILADEEFRKSNSKPGFYAIYMTHNQHFLSFVYMMQGKREAALKSTREMLAAIPPEFLRDYGPIADGFMAVEYEVLMRFGEWNQILSKPEPPKDRPLAYALWRFTRVSAFTALDRFAEAKEERKKFLAATNQVPKEATFGNNSAHTLLKIALHVMDGEIAARENQFDKAISSLQQAKQIEDSLLYDEPPDWILPVRHTLGATLLRAGKYAQAENVYREDLKKFPGNGWSLYGLGRALALQKRTSEMATIEEEFRKAWAGADTTINASCLCQEGV